MSIYLHVLNVSSNRVELSEFTLQFNDYLFLKLTRHFFMQIVILTDGHKRYFIVLISGLAW